MQLKLYAMLLGFALVCSAPQPSSGNEIVWRSVGLRGGVNDHRNDEDFKQYEGFTTWKLPWSLQWNSGWTLGTYLEANAGVLRGISPLDIACNTCPMAFFTNTIRV